MAKDQTLFDPDHSVYPGPHYSNTLFQNNKSLRMGFNKRKISISQNRPKEQLILFWRLSDDAGPQFLFYFYNIFQTNLIIGVLNCCVNYALHVNLDEGEEQKYLGEGLHSLRGFWFHVNVIPASVCV